MPLSFIPNVGQTDAQVRYHARGLGSMFFTPNAVVLALPIWSVTQTLTLHDSWSRTSPITTSVIALQYTGANPTPTITSAEPLSGVANFLRGTNRANWRTNVATYAGITYQQLYPGIDLHFDGTDGQLKSTYIVAAGADPSRIRWRYRGGAQVQTDATGNLLITIDSQLHATRPVTITEAAPTAWQMIGGQQVPVAVRYVIAANNSISFVISGYDTRYELTIDPTLAYTKTFAGSGSEEGLGIAVDSVGNAYIAGWTDSTDFPTNGSYQLGPGGGTCGPNPCRDAFVAKLNPSGTQLLYSTYLSGATGYSDQSSAIAVDGQGNAYITGEAGPGFPTTSGAYQTTQVVVGSSDAFVTKLNAAGNLVYSTYLGGGSIDRGNGIAIDSAGNAYITGNTHSGSFGSVPFPTQNAYQPAYQGAGSGSYGDAFVTKLNATGTGLIYSTYLGGSNDDQGKGIAVDASGSAYVIGGTQSSTFPTQNAFQSFGGGTCGAYPCQDGFVTKLSPAGNTLIYSTFLGGNDDEVGYGIAIDIDGNAYLAGFTASPNFPLTNAYQSASGGGDCGFPCSDAFVAKLNPSGTAKLYSTYLGGTFDDYARGIAVSTTGEAVVVGVTYAPNFPLVAPSTSAGASNQRLFVSRFTRNGNPLVYSTTMGGNTFYAGSAIALDASDSVYVTGYAAMGDVLVAKLARDPLRDDSWRTGGEVGCACQYQKPKPVNTRTGSFWTSATDIQVESPGPTLAWSRIYASQAVTDTTGVLGPGWQHPYATRLLTPSMSGGEAGKIVIVSGRTNRLRFSDRGSGNYLPASGIFSSLTQSGGNYIQTLRDQTQYTFDGTTGRLTAMRDPQGRQVTLTYDTSTPARLTQIIDASDSTRKLTLTYDTSGRIKTVGDGTRTVQYSYDAVTSDLASVTDVRGQLISYAYYTTSHLLKSVTNALNQVVEQVDYTAYTPFGKVKNQTFLDGQQRQFQYLTASTVITTTGVDGRRDIQTISYAGDNTMTGMVVNGQSILGAAFDTTFSPGVVRDGNNNSTQTVYSSAGLPRTVTNALTQTTQLAYDINNNLIQAIDPLGNTSRYRYDSFNNVISTTVGIAAASAIRATTLYTYTADGKLLTDQRSADAVVTHYEYTGTKLTKLTVGYGSALAQATTYAYDSLGRMTSTTVGFGTALARTDTTVYNPDNTVAKTIQNVQGTGVFNAALPDRNITTTYGYDKLGRTIAMTDTLGTVSATHYSSRSQVDWVARNLTPFQRDSQGQPIFQSYATTKPDANVATLYGYDGLGRTVLVTETGILTGTFNTSTFQFSAAIPRVTRTEYDTLSRPITTTLNYRPGLPVLADTNVQMIAQYDGASNLIWQRDALGRWSKTEYDALNRPTKTIANYQDGNPLTGPRDADIVSTTSYDLSGRVAQSIDNYVNGVFTVTEPITDRVTLYQYDALSRPITTTLNYDPSQNTRTDTNQRSVTAYDPITQRLLGQRDPLGRWAALQYDALGRVTTTIQNCRSTGGVAAYQSCLAYSAGTPDRNVANQSRYDLLGRTFETVDSLSYVAHSNYDGLGRTTAVTRNYVSGGTVDAQTNVKTQTGYDALGRTTVITDAIGAVTRESANRLDQTTMITDTLSRVTRTGYDGAGTQRWTRLPDGRITVAQVDGLGRVVTTIANYQNGAVSAGEASDTDLITRTVYDAVGRRVQTRVRTSPTVERVTQLAYDNLDRLIGVTENVASGACPNNPCNVVTQYQYDRAGNRTAIIDALNSIRRFSYDAANRPTQSTDALSRSTSWEYDIGGRVTTQHDPRGSSYDLSYTYDDLDRLLQTAAGSSANLTPISATYNARGDRLSLTDGTGTTNFTPDPLGRISQLAAPNTGSVSYQYNARGDRTKLTYPGTGAPVIDYTYFADRQLQNVKQGSTTLATYGYDPVGRLQSVAREWRDHDLWLRWGRSAARSDDQREQHDRQPLPVPDRPTGFADGGDRDAGAERHGHAHPN